MEIPDHGDADQGIRVGFEQLFGKAFGLAAEDQAIAFLELHVGVPSRGLGGATPIVINKMLSRNDSVGDLGGTGHRPVAVGDPPAASPFFGLHLLVR